MNVTKLVVKVNRRGTRAPEYVQRIDRIPIHMTTNRKLALLMGEIHGPRTLQRTNASGHEKKLPGEIEGRCLAAGAKVGAP